MLAWTITKTSAPVPHKATPLRQVLQSGRCSCTVWTRYKQVYGCELSVLFVPFPTSGVDDHRSVLFWASRIDVSTSPVHCHPKHLPMTDPYFSLRHKISLSSVCSIPTFITVFVALQLRAIIVLFEDFFIPSRLWLYLSVKMLIVFSITTFRIHRVDSLWQLLASRFLIDIMIPVGQSHWRISNAFRLLFFSV